MITAAKSPDTQPMGKTTISAETNTMMQLSERLAALGRTAAMALFFLGTFLLYMKSAYGADDYNAPKKRVALSYIDCDGDFTIRNGRLGINLDGRFVADTILGATYVGATYVWGGEDKRYTLLFSEDLSTATFAATSGGSTHTKCHPAPR
jgi:hypothetical protein